MPNAWKPVIADMQQKLTKIDAALDQASDDEQKTVEPDRKLLAFVSEQLQGVLTDTAKLQKRLGSSWPGLSSADLVLHARDVLDEHAKSTLLNTQQQSDIRKLAERTGKVGKAITDISKKL